MSEEKIPGVGDPQIYKGKAGRPPRFNPGDPVRVKDLPDLFYSRCQYYTRGIEGTVLKTTHESPAAEDEAWDNTEKIEWFYMVIFKQTDLWPEYPETFSKDTILTEVCETWLEPA